MRFRRPIIAWPNYLKVFDCFSLALLLVAFLGNFYHHGMLGRNQRRLPLETAIGLPATEFR